MESIPVVLHDIPIVLGPRELSGWRKPDFDLLTLIANVKPLGSGVVSARRRPDRAGHVSIHGQSFIAEPPFGARTLLHMLLFTAGLNWVAKGEAPVTLPAGRERADESIRQLLAAALVESCRRVLGQHITQEYIRNTAPSRTIRGRVHPSNPGIARGAPLCTYFEKSTDNPQNRLLTAGLRQATHILVGTPSGGRAIETHGRFLDISQERLLPVGQVDRIIQRLNPHMEHYRPSLVLARSLLFGYLPTDLMSAGTLHLPGMVFDLGRLFEEFMHRVIAQALNGTPIDVHAQLQIKRAITDADGNTYAAIRPDIAVIRSGVVQGIFDAKFKPNYTRMNGKGLPAKRVSSADLYQLFYYQRHHQANQGLLPRAYIVAPQLDFAHTLADRYKRIEFRDHAGVIGACEIIPVPLEPLVNALIEASAHDAVRETAPELHDALCAATQDDKDAFGSSPVT